MTLLLLSDMLLWHYCSACITVSFARSCWVPVKNTSKRGCLCWHIKLFFFYPTTSSGRQTAVHPVFGLIIYRIERYTLLCAHRLLWDRVNKTAVTTHQGKNGRDSSYCCWHACQVVMVARIKQYFCKLPSKVIMNLSSWNSRHGAAVTIDSDYPILVLLYAFCRPSKSLRGISQIARHALHVRCIRMMVKVPKWLSIWLGCYSSVTTIHSSLPCVVLALWTVLFTQPPGLSFIPGNVNRQHTHGKQYNSYNIRSSSGVLILYIL